MLVPGDAFRNMSGPVSWLVSLALGLVGALVGYLIFTVGLGVGDTNIFDWGGVLSALIGTVIVLLIATWVYYDVDRAVKPVREPAKPDDLVRRPSIKPGLREMITLKHLMAGRIPTNLGPSAEGWTRTLTIIVLVLVVAGIVAMWNRSRYHP
jgi:uncharacterized membrane protein YeaQ/YmgE (transglycosylase-associated protein family)